MHNAIREVPRTKDSEPPIVGVVRMEDLDAIKAGVELGVDLDERQIWSEGDRAWYRELAQMVAVQRGYVDIVKELLLNQADPMLESCTESGVFKSALQVARDRWTKSAKGTQSMAEVNRIINMVRRVNALWRKCNPHYVESADAKLPRKEKKKPSRLDISMTLSFCK